MADVKRATPSSKTPKRKIKSKPEKEKMEVKQEPIKEAPLEMIAEVKNVPIHKTTPAESPKLKLDELVEDDDSQSVLLSKDSRNDSGQPQMPFRSEVQSNLGSEYTIHTYFDKPSNAFVATVIEFPALKTTAKVRELAVTEIEDKLEIQIREMKRSGATLPEAIHTRQYPETIEIPVSQGMYRRLDLLSRMEKTSMDQLLTELLTSSLEKRLEHKSDKRNFTPQQGQSSGGGQNQRHHHHNNNNQNSQRRQGQHSNNRGGGGGGRNFQQNMDNGENFMEYVRNLEKGGGTPTGGNWRKK